MKTFKLLLAGAKYYAQFNSIHVRYRSIVGSTEQAGFVHSGQDFPHMCTLYLLSRVPNSCACFVQSDRGLSAVGGSCCFCGVI